MKRKKKRIIILVLLVIIFTGTGIAIRNCSSFHFIKQLVMDEKRFPLAKIFRTGPSAESESVSKEKNQSEAPHSLFYNFEADPNSYNKKELYKDIAHSGHFSAKAFGKNAFSASINRNVTEVGIENLKAVAMSAWVYIFPGSQPIEAAYVFTAFNKEVNITWQGISVSGKDIPRGKWFKISGFFDLSQVPFTKESRFQIYFWNNSSNDILVDDFYVAFGGPHERKGDSTRVDMTLGSPFIPKFNFPPFPVQYFGKEEIGNNDDPFMISDGKIREGHVLPEDLVFNGHFLTSDPGTEDILVKQGKSITLYSFCQEQKRFGYIITDAPKEITSSKILLTGKFSNASNDQILAEDAGGFTLFGMGKNVNPCKASGQGKAAFSLLWKGNLPGLTVTPTTRFIAGDFDADRKAELLVVSGNGSWKLFKFTGKNWTELTASKTGIPVAWNSQENENTINAGRFLQKYPQDILLTVFKEKNGKGNHYTLTRFDPVSRTFVDCFGERRKNIGLLIGKDTLKTTDEFFTGSFDKSGQKRIFRYNREWRYDLKEIRFNDSTYQILSDIDFTGYQKDHNPKYFESLRIIPGSYLHPGTRSFLLLEKNGKNNDLLPDAVQIYSFKKTP